MSCTSFDLTIDGALADPVIAAALRADRVDPRQFETLLRATARTLRGTRRRDPGPFHALPGRVRAAAKAVCPW